MLESIKDNPIATWRAPIPKLVQTPNKVHIIDITSTISPIHPNIQSPIKGYKQDFIVKGSFSRQHIKLNSKPTRENMAQPCKPKKCNNASYFLLVELYWNIYFKKHFENHQYYYQNGTSELVLQFGLAGYP